jgi:hypothetical protein
MYRLRGSTPKQIILREGGLMAGKRFNPECAEVPKSEMFMKIENESRKTAHYSPNDAVRIVPLPKPEAQALAPAAAPSWSTATAP